MPIKSESTQRSKPQRDTGVMLDDGLREKILLYLAAYILQARTAVAKFRELAGKDANVKPFRGNIEYWEHCIGSANYLAKQLFRKQNYLTLEDKSELEEVIRQWRSDYGN